MKCPYTNCTKSEDCTILSIIKKIPVSMDKCSYSVTKTQLEKQEIKAQKKALKEITPKKPKFKKDKPFKGKKKEVSGDE